MKADGRERALCLREGTARKLQAQAGLGESGQSLEQSQWVWGRGGLVFLLHWALAFFLQSLASAELDPRSACGCGPKWVGNSEQGLSSRLNPVEIRVSVLRWWWWWGVPRGHSGTSPGTRENKKTQGTENRKKDWATGVPVSGMRGSRQTRYWPLEDQNHTGINLHISLLPGASQRGGGGQKWGTQRPAWGRGLWGA